MKSKELISGKDQLKGAITVKFSGNKSFNDFCEKNFNNFDKKRFEAFAIRFFYGKETVVTLYAFDKERAKGSNYSENKFPVKKFKSLELRPENLMGYLEEINFTLTSGDHDLNDMEVINK